MRNCESAQNGRSMVEMLGVLAIIGVLSVGGIAGYTKAMDKFRLNKTIDQISTLVAQIKTAHYAVNEYSAIGNRWIKKMNLVSSEMYDTVDDDILTNAYKGDVYVAPAPIPNPGSVSGDKRVTDGAFVLTYTGLKRSVCIELVSLDWTQANGGDLLGMEFGKAGSSTSAKMASNLFSNDVQTNIGSGVVGYTDMPVTLNQANAVCDCSSEASCYVAWKYK